MQQISVILVLPSFVGGGAEKVILSLVDNLNTQHFEVTLIVQNGKGQLKCNISKERIIDLKSSRYRNSFLNLIMKINTIKPDIILSTFPHITLTLLLFKKILPKKTQIIAREPNMVRPSLDNSPFPIMLKILHKMCLPKADKVIVSSESMANDLIRRGIKKSKLALITNPVDSVKIREVNKFNRHPGSGIRLLGIGRLVYQKGFDRILPLLKNIEGIHLTVLGEGPEIHNLKALSIRMKVQDKVKFLGYKKDPYSYLVAADYLVLPSRWEGLPNVALESLALGTPVICFKEIVGLKDMLKAVAKKSLYFCKDEKNMEILLSNLPMRFDYQNPTIRNNLLNNFNNPQTFSLKIEKFIKEMVFAKRN